MLRPYAYNGDGVLVGDGTTTYAQDLAAPLSQVLNDGTANYVYGHARLRALDGPWYVGDALGSVRQILDDAGAVLATTNYDPWGTPQGSLSAPFGFTGEVQSQGLVYLRARWYDPGSDTFLTKDPFAGFPRQPYSLHPYQYAYSNPLRWTDPSGRCVVRWAMRGASCKGERNFSVGAPSRWAGSLHVVLACSASRARRLPWWAPGWPRMGPGSPLWAPGNSWPPWVTFVLRPARMGVAAASQV